MEKVVQFPRDESKLSSSHTVSIGQFQKTNMYPCCTLFAQKKINHQIPNNGLFFKLNHSFDHNIGSGKRKYNMIMNISRENIV